METGKKEKILVTGGAGFLGSHIVDALVEDGYDVSILDLNPSKLIPDGVKVFEADILNFEDVCRAMAGIDIVYHLAALADIDEAYEHPFETMNINVMGTVNILKAAQKCSAKRVIFGSSIYVYSRTGSFYRVSKQAAELLLEAFYERYGLNYTILRFGTLYGPRADKSNSVFRLLNEALNSGKIDFKGSGHEVREYIHVRDAARICIKVLDDQFAGQTLILTGHHRIRVAELLEMIKEIFNFKIKVSIDPHPNTSHYNETPYSYNPRAGRKIVMNTYCDLGQSLIEILEEMDNGNEPDKIEL